jgi:carboxyl-terminal processing protease
MKYIKFYILLLISIRLLASDSTKIEFGNLEPEPQHMKVAPLIVKYLANFHYQKRAIDDSLSAETFDRYIDKLDPIHVYFYESDIERLQKYRYRLDDYLVIGHVEPAYEIFHLYQQRMAERLIYAFKRLEAPFDYTKDEYLDIDRDQAPWAKSEQELDDYWRKRLKNESLSLKLGGKEQDEIVKLLRKRYKRAKKNIEQFQSEDVFQIFMNSFSESFDPHTSYFSPKNFDDFKIQMSQAYSGIGARLTTEEDYTVVKEIIAGGPAEKSDALHEDDKIIGVGQNKHGEIEDVVGWRIDDVVQLIRGEKETIVRLQILKAGSMPGAPSDTISLMRDKVKLEDRSATGRVIKISLGDRDFHFGVIDIPSFYSDFDGKNAGEKDFKSTTHDVNKILKKLQADTLDGVIIDLRRNGGGFLNEAISLTGLFIDEGPVVQVRSSTGKVSIEWDDEPGKVYSGPLAVLVDRISASASEIFAAAIQDYGRGIIIGSQTFGKGTVQNAVGLNRFFPNTDKKLGQLKITIAKFYRIDGGSTQHVGVIPDISFPSRFELMDFGESAQKNALLWDQIGSLNYLQNNDLTTVIPKLTTRTNLRVSEDPRFVELNQSLEEFDRNRNRKQISLNMEVREKEREEAEKKKKEKKEKEKDNEDLLITESARILSDYIMISEK